MWPMLWAFWFAADGLPNPKMLFIFILGTILTRSAGCAINDFADRKFDGQVARTRTRPLATGDLSAADALVVTALLMLAAFILVLFTNRLTVILSIGALILACVYPFTKRFTSLPQVFLGAAFAFAIPMAFSAQTGHLGVLAWVVFSAGVLWPVAYDTLYAMADREDDLRLGVKSSAILFGRADLIIVGVIQCLVLLIMTGVGVYKDRGSPYYIGLVMALGFVVYQLYIARQREPHRCFQAFLNNNYIGMVIFLGIALDYATGTNTTS